VVALNYSVTAEQDGRFWFISVPAIGHFTQARNVGEIEEMARDLIELMTGGADIELDVTFILAPSVREHLDRAAEARQAEEAARTLAAAELRAAAKDLRSRRMSYKDVGAVLSVSHQRAHQLVNS
jgi:hypothetical protein